MKTQILDTGKKRDRIARRVALWIFGIAGIFVLLFAGACCFVSWWLTPERLARIASYEAEKYLAAKVDIRDADFTLMSSFPHFKVRLDSVEVRSESLGKLSTAQRDSLPENPEFLASFSRLSGGVNIVRLLAGRIDLKDVEVSDLKVNLVALNDSVTNYDIVRSKSSGRIDIPRFSADSVFLIDPQPIAYYSAATASDISLRLREASLVRQDSGRNSYNLSIGGIVDATVDSLEILSRFPFRLDGDVAFSFKPFGVRMTDYAVDLGNTRGNLNLAMELGDSLRIDNLDYRLGSFDAMGLLSYFPTDIVPVLEGVRADLGVEACAKLTSPYVLTPERLPSFEVTLSSPHGTVEYTAAGSRSYTVNNNGIRAIFRFDGANPRASVLELPAADVSGEGIAARLSGKVTEILGAPKVEARLLADGDAATIRRLVPGVNGLAMKGNVHLDTRVRFMMDSLTSSDLHNVEMRGHADVGRYRVKTARPALDASGEGLRLTFAASGAEVTPDGLTDVSGRVHVSFPSFSYRDADRAVKARGLTLNGRSSARRVTSSTSLVPVSLHAAAKSLSMKQDTLSADMTDMHLAGSVSRVGGRPAFAVTVKAGAGHMADGRTDMALTGLVADISAVERKTAVPAPAPMPVSADRTRLDRTSHTPEYISFEAPEEVRSLFAGWDVRGNVTAKSGDFVTPAYPVHNYLSNVDLGFSLDSIEVRGLELRSQRNHMALSGKVTNLRDFVISDTPQPLRLQLLLALDTINTNSIAHTYETGVELLTGKPYYTKVAHDSVPLTAADSMTMLVPRNLEADITATIKETVYKDLRLQNLAADVNIAGGNVSVTDLSIGSDFGKAGMTFDYSTADIDRLGMKLGAHLDSIDVVRFFENFHTLLVMMPQMHNLSGYISAQASAGLGMFPDMFMNVPSIEANVDLQGRQLLVHQDDFIRHITRMLMIHNDGDLHIHDLDVHASVHDNLMELYPFEFAVENYSLNMLGLNNFNGDMYYHIGVDRWPLHIPFGINIKGDFHHPEFRFGGAHYSDDKAWPIISGITGNYDINLMRELKYYLKEFIHAAAESADDPASDFAFPVASSSSSELAAR